MSIRFTPKYLLAGLILASVLVFGTMYAVAQYGPSSDVTFSDEVTLQGTVVTIDEDHGFTMVADGVTYYIGIPYTVDKTDLGIIVGSEVTVTGYIVDSPMMESSSYIMIHATSINGIVIDHEMQSQDRDGSCGGMGPGNGHGSKYNNRNR